ncbi:MAG: rhodanese-like domain-containing protein [Betaproteobacteria bacterium]|nr:rhodanese-like domain-containing protein [Betaproteobacteria bacterium]
MRPCLIALIAALAASPAFAEVIDIDNAELERLARSGVPVIDIRTAPEWAETGIVAGSHLLTYFDEKGRADPPAWLEKVKPIAKPGEPVILICRSGNRTKAAGQYLSQQAGYATVYNVKSGIKGWRAENRPVTAAAPAVGTCRADKTC